MNPKPTGTEARVTPEYYDKRLPDGSKLDVYAICDLYGVCDPAIFHAIKKLLRAGKGSGGKSKTQDVQEAKDSLTRYLEILHAADPHPTRQEIERGIAEGRSWRWKYKAGGRWSDWFDSRNKPTWLEGLEYELAPIEPPTSLDEDVARRIRDTEYTRL